VCAAVSLARDGDIRYDRADLEEATALFGAVPERLRLTRDGGGVIRYAARGLEPWLVSPLVPRLGARAFPVFHALVLAAAAVLTWVRLGSRTARGAAWITSLLAASALPVWVFRFTPEAFHAALALAGLALAVPAPGAEIEDQWTTPAKRVRRVGRGLAAGALLGLVAWEMPFPGMALLAAPLTAVPATMGAKRRKLVWAFAAATSGVGLAVVMLLHTLPFASLRGVDPLRAQRHERIFSSALPDERGERFDVLGEAISPQDPAGPDASWVKAHALRDVFVGRFSGALWWYPLAAVASAVVLIRRREPWRIATLALGGVALSAQALLLPHSFAGWADGPGSRAAAVLYPLAIVASHGVLGTRSLIVGWALAGLLLGEPLTDPLAAVRSPGFHARTWPYTWLPVDLSRAGSLPTGRTMPLGGPDRHVVDLDEDVDVVYASCNDSAAPSSSIGCFWTPGTAAAELLVWSDRPRPPDAIWLHAGPRRSRVTIDVGQRRARARLLPNQALRIAIDGAGRGMPMRWHERDGWVWPVTVRSSNAFQPAERGVGRDRRWYGVEVALVDDGDARAAVASP